MRELKCYKAPNCSLLSRHNCVLVCMWGQGRGLGADNFCSLSISAKANEEQDNLVQLLVLCHSLDSSHLPRHEELLI